MPRRQRYRIIDRVRLTEMLGLPDGTVYRKWHEEGIEEILRRPYFYRGLSL